jgi:hypothetical protein
MTVVARFGINGLPIVIGDLLLSIEDPSASLVSVPTTESLLPVFPPGSTCVPCGLRQKVAVVADNLVVGWAGTMSTAGDVIAELVERSKSAPFTNESLRTHFDGLSKTIWDEIGLVGVIDDPDKTNSFCCDKRSEFTSPLLGKYALLGSGAPGVKEMLEKMTRMPEGLEGPVDAVGQSFGFVWELVASLLGMEVLTLRNLNDFYGAGYEIATRQDKRYAKVDDMIYLFWRAFVTAKGQIRVDRLPVRACRYAYHKDILVIRSIKLEDKGTSQSAEQRLFYISPVYRQIQPAELSGIAAPSMNARNLCNVFIVTVEGRGRGFLGMLRRREYAGEMKWVHFSNENTTQMMASVQDQFLYDAGMQIHEMLKESPALS